MVVVSHPLVEGQQPVVPLPVREPVALRAAVARLDPAALARFESDWTAATARARDEYSLHPARYFVEHWFSWVAVERWQRGCVPASASSQNQATARSAGQQRPRSARSCGRPRQPLHDRLDMGIRPGRDQRRRRAHADASRRRESLASRIADAVAVRRIGTPFDWFMRRSRRLPRLADARLTPPGGS